MHCKMEAKKINVGSYPNEIITAYDFVAWYGHTMFCTEMCDNFAIYMAEKDACREEAKRILNKMDFSADDLLTAEKQFIKDHPEDNYCIIDKKDLKIWKLQ